MVTDLVALHERSRGLPDPAHMLGSTAELGTALHHALQARLTSSRRKQATSFVAELAVSHTVHHRAKDFMISGRVDLAAESETEITVYEIKSCDHVSRIRKQLLQDAGHPAAFQTALYALMLSLSRGKPCRGAVVLVSAQNLNMRIVPLQIDLQATMNRLMDLLDITIGQHKAARLTARRKRLFAAHAHFPFGQLRGGQQELLSNVTEAIKQTDPILLMAPTGSGKTVSALFPALTFACTKSRTVVFATARNSQKESFVKAIDDINARNRINGITALAVTCASREALCLSQGEQRVCDPNICPYAAEHHARLRKSRVFKTMARKGGVFTVSQIRKVGSFLGVCPFEMVMELTEHADAVACDYNQVFSERARLDSLFGKPGSPARLQLIVDEAHNLPGRMRALASPELSPMAVPGDASPHHILFFQKTNEAVRRLCIWLAHAAGRGQHTSNAGPADKSHEPGLTSALEIPLSHGAAEAMDRFRLEVAAYYAKVQRAVRDQAFDDPARMRMQDIETFCQTIQTESFGKEHPFSLTLEQGAGRSVLRILCKDSAHVLAGCIRPLAAPLFMSATLEPTEYFARSLGLKESPSICILRQGTPFPAEHRRLFIVPQVSSVFRLRRLQIPKIAQVIGKILDLQGVNTFVFSPSFGFAAELLQSCPVPAHCDVHLQTPRMSPAALETLLEGFRSSNRPQVLFGVMRGSLSEGIDLPGRALQSVIVVGPALPPVSLEQDLLEAYETAHGNNGFDQASIIPAMIHVNQALGRLIRTPTDVGTCFLLDRRFTEQPYFDRLAKEWRHEDPAKHVSQALAQDISHFWASVSGVSQTLSSPLELR